MADDHALYVKWYDTMFSGRHYRSEVDDVLALYRETTGSKADTVLDLGCGTGNHAVAFKRAGCQVMGWDMDDAMLEVARGKGVTVGIPSDRVALVTALFHVANYSLRLETLDSLLALAYDRLTPGGMFVFDAWDADVLEADPPKPMTFEHYAPPTPTFVRRRSIPSWHRRSGLVTVTNDTKILDGITPIASFVWQYTHRVWTPGMIADRLKVAGFTRQLEPRRWGKRDLLFAAVK